MVGLNKPSTYSVRVKNNDPEDLFVDLEIEVPSELTVTFRSKELVRTGNKYAWSGSLEQDETKSFEVRVQGAFTGSYEISSELDMEVFGTEFEEELSQTLEISTTKIDAVLSLPWTEVREKTAYTITASLKNNDPLNNYYEINGVFSSDLFDDIDVVYPSMQKGEFIEVVDDKFLSPSVNRSETFKISFSGDYQTVSGQKYSFETEKSLTVVPVRESIAVSKSLSKTKVRKGENFTVQVFVENKVDDPVEKIEVSEIIPESLLFLGGKRGDSLDLFGDEKEQAYIYKVEVPEDFKGDTIVLTTNASFKGFVWEVNSAVEVEDVVVSEDETGKVGEVAGGNSDKGGEGAGSNESKEETTSKSPKYVQREESQGFFTRLIDSIQGFFDSLFS
jgi:hypothetical protein